MTMRLLLVLSMVLGSVHAREWKSADGSKKMEAVFVAVQGEELALHMAGKTSIFPLMAFAGDDQQFAKNAHAITETATKLGPQSFELVHPVEDGSGWICRLALKIDPKAGGPKLFTGEVFFLLTKDVAAYQKGQRVENQPLFGAGGRTYHPLVGDPSMLRAYAIEVEQATQAWMDIMATAGDDPAKQAPNVLEPDVKIATRHGWGVVIGKSGLVAIDPEMVKKDFKSLVIHHEGKDYPAVPYVPKDKDGSEIKVSDVQLVLCKVPMEAARIGARKPVEVGQNVFAISYELSSGKKSFSTKATVTRGIISRLAAHGSFQHDARLPPENLGGFLIGEKGDVLGFFFQTQTSGGNAKKQTAIDKPTIEGLGSCVSTQAIAGMLTRLPGQSAPRSGAAFEDMEAHAKTLLASSVLVMSTFEIHQPRQIRVPKAAGPAVPTPVGGGPLPTGWSLSKSGIRHNAKCHYYNAQNPCQAVDGRPCKVCGG
jgi:S1-C subfamily serine protease